MKGGVAGLALVLAMAGTVAADVKPGEKKKAPDAQGSGSEQPQGEEKKNPLPPIVERMKDAERRLAESDSGAWTQAEQEKIVEALDLERDAADALDRLIKEIESRPP